MTFLGTEQIRSLINDGMIKGYIDLNTQLGSDGFDLTVEKIYERKTNEKVKSVTEVIPPPLIGFWPNERYVPEGKEIPIQQMNDLQEVYGDKIITTPTPNPVEGWILKQGSYTVAFNEELYFPINVCGISIQRSSLPRSLIETNTGKWNGGYHGKGTNMLTVKCPEYIVLKDARIVEMNFIPIMGNNKPYNGIWQHEGVKQPEWQRK